MNELPVNNGWDMKFVFVSKIGHQERIYKGSHEILSNGG